MTVHDCLIYHVLMKFQVFIQRHFYFSVEYVFHSSIYNIYYLQGLFKCVILLQFQNSIIVYSMIIRCEKRYFNVICPFCLSTKHVLVLRQQYICWSTYSLNIISCCINMSYVYVYRVFYFN